MERERQFWYLIAEERKKNPSIFNSHISNKKTIRIITVHQCSRKTIYPRTYPSNESSSSRSKACPSWKGKTVIWLKDRLSWRKAGLRTVGSSIRRGPMQLRETLSVFNAGKPRSSTGNDCSWLPWRSRRVRLLKFWEKNVHNWIKLNTLLEKCIGYS